MDPEAHSQHPLNITGVRWLPSNLSAQASLMSSSSESAPLIAGGRGGSGPFRNLVAMSPVIVVAAPPTDGRPDGRPDDQTALATAPPVNGDAELGESDSSLSGSHGGRRKGAWVGALGALVGGAVVAVIIVATVLEANLLDFG